MKKRSVILALLTAALAAGGCSIAGTWKTVKVDPEDAAGESPFQIVTFSDDGQYSATIEDGNQIRTRLGKYKWDGMKLTVMPGGGESRVYPGRLSVFTGRLVLTHQQDDRKITATLEKIEDLPK